VAANSKCSRWQIHERWALELPQKKCQQKVCYHQSHASWHLSHPESLPFWLESFCCFNSTDFRFQSGETERRRLVVDCLQAPPQPAADGFWIYLKTMGPPSAAWCAKLMELTFWSRLGPLVVRGMANYSA